MSMWLAKSSGVAFCWMMGLTVMLTEGAIIHLLNPSFEKSPAFCAGLDLLTPLNS